MAGKSFYANPDYTSEISSLAVSSMSAAGSAAWATKATEVVRIGTFVWLVSVIVVFRLHQMLISI